VTLVDLDLLGADDLAHLAAIARKRERARRVPPWWRPDEPEPPDPETTVLLEDRGRRYLALIERTTLAAREMTQGLSVFGPGGPKFTPEDIVRSLVKVATDLGLDEGDARDAAGAGIRQGRTP